MDREIPKSEIRKAKGKKWLYATLGVTVLLLGGWMLRRTLSNTISRSEIRTAVAEKGDVEQTLNASGEVFPEFEQVITSPISAVIQKAYFTTGAQVRTGDRILDLDKEFTQIEFDKQQDALELKRNSILKTKLELDKSFYDLTIQDSIKACRIKSLQADLENAKRLFKAGGGTREAIAQAETNLQVTQLEKRQLENDIRSRQAIMRLSMRESEIAAAIQEKDLKEFARKLQQADIVATRSGVLTYVNLNFGTKVGEGELLARIADLSSYKILGTVSDVYAEQMRVGMPVIIRLNDSLMSGELINIHPAVSNNVVSFDVMLHDQQHHSSQLRPQLKVEVFLVTGRKQNAVRVRNGPAFKGGAVQDVFVLRPDGTAERRRIKIGMSNFDFVEITEGIAPGETVIISDMSNFRNATTIEIQ